MAATLNRSGIWRSAGMGGTLVGLDLTEALASLPSGIDRDLARRYFIGAEQEFIAAWHEANPPPNRS